jgi:parvulin-like peptidyl-prolyl isomerase
LLKVDPSAPTATWVATDARAQALVVRVRAGEDFGALARKYSADHSSAKGGDMGYIHGGMLPEGTVEAVAKLKAGETTNSLRVLQGMAVLQLVERKPARLMPFEAVKTRAGELAEREQGEQVWSSFVLALRAKTPAQLDQSRFLPLAAPGSAPPKKGH